MQKIFMQGSNNHIFALVDDEDYEALSKKKWWLGSNGYACNLFYVTGSGKKKQKTQSCSMHRMIMGNPDKVQVDHINGVRLDNRRSNLRIATHAQNCHNSKTTNPLGVKGVTREGSVFIARIQTDSLGYYPTAYIAALAYDREARDRFKEFAKLNYPDVVDYTPVISVPKHNKYERTSTHIGVSYANGRKAKQKWRAVYKKKHLGWFVTELEAINAYNEATNESCS